MPEWISNLRTFIINRRAPKKRENIAKLLEVSGCHTLYGWLSITHALSLIDNEYDGVFFSVNYAGQSGLFEKMNIWQEEKYHSLEGKFPVISLSFADIKDASVSEAKGIPAGRIRKYGFAFEGKNVLIG